MARTPIKSKTNHEGTTADVIIQQPHPCSVFVEIVGTAHLIQHNFSQKTIEQMLRKHMGITVQREKKKPRECIEDATIYNTADPKRVCLSPTAIKKAILTAASQIEKITKGSLKTRLFMPGKSIPITYSAMIPRMDMVRTSGINRQPDVRFRPSFSNWKARFELEFSHELRVQSVIDLIYRAGSIGVGEWRPEKDGTFGTFKVSRAISDPKEVAEVRDICTYPLVPLVIPEWAMDTAIDPQILQQIADSNSANYDVDAVNDDPAFAVNG